jgi:serine/threonine protein kinase
MIDIWAMGCILHEVMIGKMLFADNLEVVDYAETVIEAVVSPTIMHPFIKELKYCLERVGVFKGNWKEKSIIKAALIQMFDVLPRERPAAEELITLAFQKLVEVDAPSPRTPSSQVRNVGIVRINASGNP